MGHTIEVAAFRETAGTGGGAVSGTEEVSDVGEGRSSAASLKRWVGRQAGG